MIPQRNRQKGLKMKISTSRGVRLAALAVATGLLATTLAACSSSSDTSKTFNIWWYDKDTAMAATWKDALAEFKKNHPDIEVKFQQKTWDQIQKAGNAILDSDKAPDLAEWNKGNATAGTASQAGLISDLTDYSKQYGWDSLIPASGQLVGRYTDGIMGKGQLYAIPTYGEYVSWFYNKDAFAKYGVAVPTTLDELDAVLAKIKAQGVTPIALGGGDYQIVHMAYALAVSKANQQWVKDFQFFENPVDFNGPEWTYAIDTINRWKSAGYFDSKVSGVKADAAVAAFEKGTYPLMLGGTWLDQDVDSKAKFAWDKFANPGSGIAEGSAGNVWVIPTRSKQKDLAAEFIDLTLSKKYQNELGSKGGLPLAADPSALTGDLAIKTNKVFSQIVAADGLGLYPDWPVAGYYDVLLKAGVQLLSDGDKAAYIKTTGDFYNQNKP